MILRRFRPYRLHILIVLIFACVLEPIHHVRSAYPFPRPSKPLDPVFHSKCVDPVQEAASTRRESAAILMLARNEDIEGATLAIRSLETNFNRWFAYPYVFLNNDPWTEDFKARIKGQIQGEAEVIFDTVDKSQWGWPTHFTEKDKKRSRANWKRIEDGFDEEFKKGTHVTSESYHHMCRFYSGFFYDHPALARFKWFWRVEPDALFTCDIPYDPFAMMAKHGKVYGYTMALWEVGTTVPSLFRSVSDFAATHARKYLQSPLWNAMHDPSWAPWPIRRWVLPFFRNRNGKGDLWNLCHFWSNFEIADLEFFRSREYRDLFRHLDQAGGIYYERWGDAPIHSLAAALLLQPEQIHYFQDIGYAHEPFQHCPIDEGVGCNCVCNKSGHTQPVCLNRLRSTVEPPR